MYLKASICNKNELFLHDSKLNIPLLLSIIFVKREVLDCSAREEVIGKGKIPAQPHTIVKQICFPNGNVLFWSLFYLSKNWMHNVVWGCAEILLLERIRGCNWHAVNSLIYNNCFDADLKVMNGIAFDQGMIYLTNIQRMRCVDKN